MNALGYVTEKSLKSAINKVKASLKDWTEANKGLFVRNKLIFLAICLGEEGIPR